MGLPFENKERKIIEIQPATTSDKFGCEPAKRKTEEIIDYGIVNIDKPEGPTSHQVSAYVKKILGISKSGHSGTLDPKVTGVLPVALGRGTRVVQNLLTAGKEYVCLMKIHDELPEAVIRKTIKQFVGNIRQMPPVKSAVKRQLRYRKIYYIDIIDIQGKCVLFKTGTQAGTYIRKLCHDIGQALGCGANMYELRRTKAGPFKEDTLCTLQDLTDAIVFYKKGDDSMLRKLIQPVENAVAHMPKIWILDSAVDAICHGASLKVPGVAKLHDGIEPDMKVAIMTLKDELVMTAVAKLSTKKIVDNDKGIVARADQVFMERGAYPKIEKV